VRRALSVVHQRPAIYDTEWTTEYHGEHCNSLFAYMLRTPTASLQRAVAMFGLNQLSEIAVTASLKHGPSRFWDTKRAYDNFDDTHWPALFTSGFTGQPRGVMVSHANIIANTDSIISYLALTELDRIMAVLPVHYCYGASLFHAHLRVGGEVVIDNRFMYSENVLQHIIETRCTGFAGVPSHFQILLRNSSFRKKQYPDLRYVQQAGGYLAPPSFGN